MKKLVIAVLAIGAMAACTKQNVQFEQPGEISIQPVAQKATKAAVDGTYYPTGEAYNFNVWAWWSLQNAGTALNAFTLLNFNYNITPIPYTHFFKIDLLKRYPFFKKSLCELRCISYKYSFSLFFSGLIKQ